MTSARRPSSPRLPRGRHALDADAAAAAQRARLHAATVQLLRERGYGATTVDELAAAGGVSTATLYGLFDGKQELVLDTFDAIARDLAGRLQGLPGADGDLRSALSGVLSAVVDVVLHEPEPARLVVVDVAAAGPPGLQRRRTLTTGLQALLRDAATRDGTTAISEPALAVLAGGTLAVVDRQLRAGRLRSLRSAALDLATWGAMYETQAPRSPPGPPPAAGGPAAGASSSLSAGLPHGRHGLPAAFVHRHQRERILEAVLEVSADQGFEATSARELVARAGISRQTFYQHFASKEDAWLAAFDEAFLGLFATVWYAASPHDDPAARLTAALTAALGELAGEPQRARLLLVDAASAGRAGTPAIDRAAQAFTRLLTRVAGDRELPAIVPFALVGGIASLVGDWVVDGRAADLADLAPALVEILFVPLLGPAAARAAAAGLETVRPATGADDDLRLMEAFAKAVARDGLAATRLSDVAQREDIELDVAHALFDDELDCATQALDVWAGQLVALAAGAFLSAALDPALAAQRALEAALEHFARTPGLSALAVADDPEIVLAVSVLRVRYTALFLQLVGGQLPPSQQHAPQPSAALEVVLEGILAVVSRFAEEDRLAALPGELHALSLQALTPFFGAEEAQRVAGQASAVR